MTSFPNLPPNGDRGLIDLNNETLDWLVYLNSSSEANVFISPGPEGQIWTLRSEMGGQILVVIFFFLHMSSP